MIPATRVTGTSSTVRASIPRSFDVVGGWHDASDYLQYVTTSATAVVSMLSAYRIAPGCLRRLRSTRRARPGPNGVPDILDEAALGDRLAAEDEPRAAGDVQSDRRRPGPSGLPTPDGGHRGLWARAGASRLLCHRRTAGDLPVQEPHHRGRLHGGEIRVGLRSRGAGVQGDRIPDAAHLLRERAVAAFAFGEEIPGVCQTAPCRAPYFYEEDNWADDMELAAAALYELTGDSGYRTKAERISPPWSRSPRGWGRIAHDTTSGIRS